MLDTTLAALVSFFLIDPLQAEMSKRLTAAGARPSPMLCSSKPRLPARRPSTRRVRS